MKYISISLIVSLIFAGYIFSAIWKFYKTFIPPECSRDERCFSSYLDSNPVQHLVLYTSVIERPFGDTSTSEPVKKVHTALNFNYRIPAEIEVNLEVPRKTRNNGTLYMHAILLDNSQQYKSFDDLIQTESVHTLALVTHVEPQAETFNPLEQNVDEKINEKSQRPFSHIITSVTLAILGDRLNLPSKKISRRLYSYMRIRNGKFLPLIQHNVLKTRMSQLLLLNQSTTNVNITVHVAPTSYGLFHFTLQMKWLLDKLRSLGFSEKDIDYTKGIFADKNLYLLSATVLIVHCHYLFDILAFKNDVSFWKKKRSLAGISARTVFWLAFSKFVIFFYLLGQQALLLQLVPVGISAVIELWKVTKVLHLRMAFSGWRVRVWRDTRADAGEQTTAKADEEAMRYLSMLLYPLCLAGVGYSLVYQPHKSWYSWALNSVVDGIDAFGFLFMLPQLFVNYRLRSVAALSWRAFMYRAFNTFMYDVFTFITTMPTAHSVASLGDDLVFLVFLYQRWLYPVDKSRTDTASSMDEAPEEYEAVKEKEE